MIIIVIKLHEVIIADMIRNYIKLGDKVSDNIGW